MNFTLDSHSEPDLQVYALVRSTNQPPRTYTQVTIPLANSLIDAGVSADVCYYSEQDVEHLFSVVYRAEGCICLIPEDARVDMLKGLLAQVESMGKIVATDAGPFLQKE